MRRRLGRLVVVAVILAVASPSFGFNATSTEWCGGSVRPGRQAGCTTWFAIPHFNAGDSIDDSTLVARIASPEANGWRVSGTIYDARGVAYFAWYCSAQRSSTTPAAGTYAGHSCGATRRMVTVRRNGRTSRQYYIADTTGLQRMTVIATVSQCMPTTVRGCNFEGRATYQFGR